MAAMSAILVGLCLATADAWVALPAAFGTPWHSHASPLSQARATVNERGVEVEIGSAFYRGESEVSRDLACLVAALYKKRTGRLRILDAFSGCGTRAARYLSQSCADFVHGECSGRCLPRFKSTPHGSQWLPISHNGHITTFSE